MVTVVSWRADGLPEAADLGGYYEKEVISLLSYQRHRFLKLLAPTPTKFVFRVITRVMSVARGFLSLEPLAYWLLTDHDPACTYA